MSQREHAEDPIWWSIKSATDFAAHRRTVVLFHTNTSSLAGAPNPMLWIDNTGDVWPELRALLAAFDPARIVVNIDRNIAFAGGLHVGEMEVLKEELGEEWTRRFVNVPMLAVEYVTARVPGQLEYYRKMQEMTWDMVAEAFSERVVTPGITTTDVRILSTSHSLFLERKYQDVQWWFREKMQALNVSTWNQPRVKVLDPSSFPGWSGSASVIKEGDVLHVDFGISAMGMHTDVQHLGYVLRPGESDVPQGLKDGMKAANRMQEIVLRHLRPGISGNDVLRACNEQMQREAIEGQVYSHPIGDHGHAPGSTIGTNIKIKCQANTILEPFFFSFAGFTNLPEFVPVFGELPILPNSFYSIELFARHFVPERNESLRFMLEENAYWDPKLQSWAFTIGRQTDFHLVHPTSSRNNAITVQQNGYKLN